MKQRDDRFYARWAIFIIGQPVLIALSIGMSCFPLTLLFGFLSLFENFFMSFFASDEEKRRDYDRQIFGSIAMICMGFVYVYYSAYRWAMTGNLETDRS